MITIYEGGQAFPGPWTNDGDMNASAPDGQVVAPGYTVQMSGMSLRDYFAAAALQGWLASMPADAKPDDMNSARRAYEFADAMLEVRRER
jgi:hypothetical protein